MTTDIKAAMNKRNIVTSFIIVTIAVAVVLLLVIPAIIRNQLNRDPSFFIIYLLYWAWYGIMAVTVRLFAKRLKRNKNDILATLAIGCELIVGFIGSVYLGDAIFKQGGLFGWLFGSIPLISGFFILLVMLFKLHHE